MADRYKVTDRVLVDHPDGYQVLVAVPGDEIPMERAVELGLVTADGKKPPRRRTRKKPAAAEGAVETAEVRRGGGGEDTGDGDADQGDGDDEGDGKADGEG